MFSGRNYCGDLELLGVFLKITIHVTFLYINLAMLVGTGMSRGCMAFECLSYYRVSHMFFHNTATFALKTKSHNPKHLRSGVESQS